MIIDCRLHTGMSLKNRFHELYILNINILSDCNRFREKVRRLRLYPTVNPLKYTRFESNSLPISPFDICTLQFRIDNKIRIIIIVTRIATTKLEFPRAEKISQNTKLQIIGTLMQSVPIYAWEHVHTRPDMHKMVSCNNGSNTVIKKKSHRPIVGAREGCDKTEDSCGKHLAVVSLDNNVISLLSLLGEDLFSLHCTTLYQ